MILVVYLGHGNFSSGTHLSAVLFFFLHISLLGERSKAPKLRKPLKKISGAPLSYHASFLDLEDLGAQDPSKPKHGFGEKNKKLLTCTGCEESYSLGTQRESCQKK